MILPVNWRNVELGDIFEFQSKSKNKASVGTKSGNYKFYTSSPIQNKYIDDSDLDGEYLIFGTGGNASIHYCNEKFSTSTDCFVVNLTDNSIITKYVFYFLKGNIHLLESGFKGAGLKHISKRYLQKIKIAIPTDKKIQKKIVAILDKAEKLKGWRREADELTDELLKSTFLEMFGDPVKNPMRWELKNLGEIGEVRSGLTLNSQRRANKENLFPYLRVANVYRNKLDINDIKYIHTSDSEFERFVLKNNDVLIVEGHGNIEEIGRAAIWNGKISNCLHQNHLIRVRLNNGKLNPYFLSYFLNSYGNHGYFSTKSRTTSGLNTISTNKVRKAKVPLPPIFIQEQFADFYNNVEKIKEFQVQSIQHIEDLFDVLTQKAFQGDLI